MKEDTSRSCEASVMKNFHEFLRTPLKNCVPINHLHYFFSLCVSPTLGTLRMFCQGSWCGVSILAQGSDLKEHGVHVMPPHPRLTVPVLPSVCVCKQIKHQGHFN